MQNLIRVFILPALITAFFAAPLAAFPDFPRPAEMGLNYVYVHTNAPPGGCGCFSMNGGNAWIGFDLPHSAAIVGEVGFEHASNIANSGQNLTLISYTAGPRYSWHKFERFVPFGQVLIGGAHASGSLSPGAGGVPGPANAFAMTAGSGLDLAVSKRFTVRAFQADYYLTHFTNGVNNHQNNFRISAGIVFHFRSK